MQDHGRDARKTSAQGMDSPAMLRLNPRYRVQRSDQIPDLLRLSDRELMNRIRHVLGETQRPSSSNPHSSTRRKVSIGRLSHWLPVHKKSTRHPSLSLRYTENLVQTPIGRRISPLIEYSDLRQMRTYRPLRLDREVKTPSKLHA